VVQYVTNKQFDGTDFGVFKTRVRAKLGGLRMLYVIDSNVPLPPLLNGNKESKEQEEDRKKNDSNTVYYILIELLDDAHVRLVTSEVPEGDASGVWKMLLRTYEIVSTASKQQLKNDLYHIVMDGSENVITYKARVLHLVSLLRGMKENISDEEILFCFFQGLPSSFKIIKVSLENQKSLTLEEVCSRIREFQKREEQENSSSVDDAQYMMNSRSNKNVNKSSNDNNNVKSRIAYCRLCKNNNHPTFDCPNRKGSGYSCFRCGDKNHKLDDCKIQAGIMMAMKEVDSDDEECEHLIY
jgi:hypothetical protein